MTIPRKGRKPMKHFLCALLALLLLCPLLPAHAEETAPVEIHTVEDLMAMAQAPEENYILMNDLDMTGLQWNSPDFSGTFDGNGHAILNLTLSQPSQATPDSYDGNAIAYETAYVGFFGTLTGATVSNLQLLNVRAVVEMDGPVFLAGIAGYMADSTISGCTVTGCLELRAHDRMFGVGGIAGYGWGLIENCTVDMTLITVDTDAATKDEQFLGGVYGTGFIDVVGCDITLDGYVSEHGYVHSGGVVGMYMSYPYGIDKHGRLTDTRVTGKITFFENNNNRRAYCKALVGEPLINSATISNNTTDFIRDERYDYTLELRPEMCGAPVYEETIVPSGCHSFGYTLYTCSGCGYRYTDHYTLFSHTVTHWTETVAATAEAEGLLTGFCDGCGLELQQATPKLEPAPIVTEPPTEVTTTEAPTAKPTESTEDPKEFSWLIPVVLILTALGILAMLLLFPGTKPGKYQK